MKTTKTFAKLVDAVSRNPRYIISEGGARSGKTFAMLQLIKELVKTDKAAEITSVVSETMPHLKRGVIRDFQQIMVADGEWDDNRWNRSGSYYTFPNGAIMEFFSADSPGKVLGSARKRLFINEVINVPFEITRQLFVRTQKTIFVDYNPAYRFYIHERYADKDNAEVIHSTYHDNNFLTPEIVAELESNRSDKNWWRVYGEGLVGELSGLIYSFEQIDELPKNANLKECYGMDFGFTHDPTALVHILADTGRKELYIEECIYKTGMTNDDIAQRLQQLGLDRRVEVFADCAEPKSIEEIRRKGFNVIAADKDAPVRSDKMRFQVQWLQGWKLFVTKASVNLIKELRNYTWAKDRDGNDLNQPIDKWNHALDALRYGAWTKLAKNTNKGHYIISIR